MLEELTQQGDLTRRSSHLSDFYRLVARATHNEVLLMLVDSTSEIFQRLLNQISPQPRPDLVDVRRSILRHLRDRNAEAAMREMTERLTRLGRYLQSQEKRPVRAAAAAKTR